MTPDDNLLTPARWAGKKCTIPQALREIEDPATVAKLEAALTDERVPSKGIEEYLRAVIGDRPGDGNHSPRHTVIRRHQIKACEC